MRIGLFSNLAATGSYESCGFWLQGDLTPALQQAGVEVVYVDLWADTRRDPGTLDIDTSKIGQVDGLTESGVLARAVTPCHYDDQAAPGSKGSRS